MRQPNNKKIHFQMACVLAIGLVIIRHPRICICIDCNTSESAGLDILEFCIFKK